jgi:anti-sigma B factor antagonist
MSKSGQADKGTAASQAGVRLDVSVESRDDQAHLVLRGELDLATVGVAEEALERVQNGAKTLVFDLRKLQFLDSSGLRFILMAAESDQGRRVVIVRGPAQVDRVFELTGASERLRLVDDPSLIDKS